jgi:hypothetical protein
VKDTNVPDGNALVEKVKIDLNMLGELVLNGIAREIDSADVVVVDQSDQWQGVVQPHKQLSNAPRLYHTVGHGAVLRLNTQTGDDILTL